MDKIELFSKHQMRLRGEIPEVFQYENLPEKFKVQVIHIIRDAMGTDSYSNTDVNDAYKFIHDFLCREYGQFDLDPNYRTYNESLLNFFLKVEDIEKALDVIQMTFFVIDSFLRDNQYIERNIEPDNAIIELNERFKENGIGYAYESGKIIRVDSIFTHAEIVKPTISLINSKIFVGANVEFLKAHEHYRHGRNQECLNECLKAFESTMKIICASKKWAFNQKDTSKMLINICFQNNLIPLYMQTQFSSLRSLLESGVPTVRNKNSGHGQGNNQIVVDDSLARFGLNLTGSCIIFLIEQSNIK